MKVELQHYFSNNRCQTILPRIRITFKRFKEPKSDDVISLLSIICNRETTDFIEIHLKQFHKPRDQTYKCTAQTSIENII